MKKEILFLAIKEISFDWLLVILGMICMGGILFLFGFFPKVMIPIGIIIFFFYSVTNKYDDIKRR